MKATKKIHMHRGLMSALVVIMAAAIFVLRYKSGLTMPNFYAEDATVFLNNVYTQNPLHTLLTPFNGYLVVGQYVIAYIAAVVNVLFGNDIIDLAVITYGVSVAFLGFVAASPFILFRKELGTWLALTAVLLTALVPMYGFDYAIIGTIGNLKFAFLYIAFLLVLARYYKAENLRPWQFVAIDAALLICVLTNVTVAFLVPLTLLPYLLQLLKNIRAKKIRLSLPMISALLLVGLSVAYVGAALLRGIPEMPGYLDGPFKKQAILPILERSTTFSLLYPITQTFTNYIVGLLAVGGVVALGFLLWKYREQRFLLVAAAWSIAIGTGLFVINRPGVGDFFLNYAHKGGPDQFFYAQNMIFIFAVAWLVRHAFLKATVRKLMFATILVLSYLVWALPYGSSFGKSSVVYGYLQPIKPNVEKACQIYANQSEVIVQVYPSPYWQWHVSKKLACDY